MTTYYRLEGQVYALPDGMSNDEAKAYIKQKTAPSLSTPSAGTEGEAPASPSPNGMTDPTIGIGFDPNNVTAQTNGFSAADTQAAIQKFKDEQAAAIDPNDLQYDDKAVVASQYLWKYQHNGQEFKGTRKDLALWGYQQMLSAGAKPTQLGEDVRLLMFGKPDNYSDEEWQATRVSYAYLTHVFSQTKWTQEALKTYAAAQVTDPVNLTLNLAGGIPKVLEGAALRKGMPTLIARMLYDAGLNGSMGAAENYLQQKVDVLAGLQDAVSPGEVTTAGVVSGAVGAVAGQAIETAGSAIGDSYRILNPKKAADSPVEPRITSEGTPVAPGPETAPVAAPEGSAAPVPGTTAVDPVLSQAQAAIDAAPATPPKPAEPVHPQYDNAVDRVVASGKATVADIKEALGVPKREAQAIITRMEEEGIISAPDARNRRTVIKTADEVKALRDARVAAPQAPEITVGDVLAKLKEIAPDMEKASLPRSIPEMVKAVQGMTEMLSKAGVRTMSDVQDLFVRMGMNPDQLSTAITSVQEAFKNVAEQRTKIAEQMAKATDPQVKEDLFKQYQALGEPQKLLGELDRSQASEAGTKLYQTQGAVLTGENRGLQPEDLMKRDGINPDLATPEQHTEYSQKYAQLWNEARQTVARTKKVKELEQAADYASKRGDYSEARRRLDELEAVMAEEADKELLKKGVPLQIIQRINEASHKFEAFQIANLFSPSTLQNTAISTIWQATAEPLWRYFGDTLMGEAALKRLSGTYYGMLISQKAAVERAIGCFKFMDNNLTKVNSDYIAEATGLSGKFWSRYPIFPKLMAGFDGYMTEILHTGYTYGETLAQASVAARRLPAHERPAFVKAAVDKAIKEAVEDMTALQKVKLLRREGVKRGLTGTTLDKWIEIQIKKNPRYFTTTKNDAAAKYALEASSNDAFSTQRASDVRGIQTALSYSAYTAEWVLNKVPILKVFQRFLRTSLKVANTGINLSPAWFLNPKQIANISGSNGVRAQAKAYGQTLTAFALALTGNLMYANGALTGGGASDPQDRYKLRVGDTEINIKPFDPASTPWKWIANYQEKVRELRIREMQGEIVSDSEWDKAFNEMSAFMDATSQTITDFNLLSLPQKMLRIAEAFQNNKDGWAGVPQVAWDQISDIFSDLGRGLVQSTITKTVATSDYVQDPKTLYQKFLQTVDPDDPSVPKRYNSLHLPVINENPRSWTTFGLNDPITDVKDKNRGLSQKAVELQKAIDGLALQADANFQMKYKLYDGGPLNGIDLRTKYPKTNNNKGKFSNDFVNDLVPLGRESYYTRINRYVAEGPTNAVLYMFAVEKKPTPYGQWTNNVQNNARIVNRIMRDGEQAAVQRLVEEENGLKAGYLKQAFEELRKRNGGLDINSIPLQ